MELKHWSKNALFWVMVIKKMILFFWGFYFLIVFLSNLTDALSSAGMLQKEFAFVSGNYGLIEAVTSRYGVPSFLNVILFTGVLLWQAFATALFSRALIRYPSEKGKIDVYLAFTVAIALWSIFIIMDELFIAYHIANLETTHIGLLSTQFISLLVIELLPSDDL